MTRIINLPKSKITKDGKVAKSTRKTSVSEKIRQRKSKKVRVATRVQKP